MGNEKAASTAIVGRAANPNLGAGVNLGSVIELFR